MNDFLQRWCRTLGILLSPLIVIACASGGGGNIGNPNYPFNDRVAEGEKGNVYAIQTVQKRGFEMNETGLFVSPRGDVQDPVAWLQKGIDRGDALSQARMAYFLMYTNQKDRRNPEKALQLAQEALGNQKIPLGATSPVSSNITSKSAIAEHKKWRAETLAKEVTELAKRAETLIQQQPLAAQGNADALYAVSQLYAPFTVSNLWYDAPNFAGSKNDHLHWLKRAADAGSLEGVTGMIANTHNPAEKRALELKAAQIRAKSGTLTPEEMYQQGNTYYASGRQAEALEWYRKAAAQGVKAAQKVVLQQTDPTVLRLQAAAKNGDANAMFQLGEYFRAGDWEGKDNALAREWYMKASVKNHAEASYQAAMLLFGDDRERQMQVAARQGHQGASEWLVAWRKTQQEQQARARQAAEAERQRQQQQRAEQDAFVARINREGSTDAYEIEVYCRYGGQRCRELRNNAKRAQQQRNREAEAANMRRIWGLHDDGKDVHYESRRRTECLRRKNNPTAVANPEFAGKSVGTC